MKKLISIVLFALCISINIYAQDTHTSKRVQAFYIEGLGSSFTYSINYDMRFENSSNGLGYRVGLGPYADGKQYYVSLPFQINYLMGDYKHHFEIGAGLTGIFSKKEESNLYDVTPYFNIFNPGTNANVVGSLLFGYRYQTDHGVMLRFSLNPYCGIFGNEKYGREFKFIPYIGGISFGYSF